MPKSYKRTILVAYVPVIHKGYLEYFAANKTADQLYVLGKDLLSKTDYIRKDLRALTPEQQRHYLMGADIFQEVSILTRSSLRDIDKSGYLIIMPDEDVSREVAKLFKRATVEFYPVFLRWDRTAIETDAQDDNKTTSSQPKDIKIMQRAFDISQKSPDIWRHVGAVLVDTTGKILSDSYNRGEPADVTLWMDGDPRNALHRGEGIETSLITHAEAFLIADAAKNGRSLNNALLYVTTFPCPPCSKLIAHSGIKACYYAGGYATLDGAKVMKAYGVKLVRVTGFDDLPGDKRRLVPYKK